MAVVVPRVVAVDNVVTTGRRVVGEAISVVIGLVTPGVEPVRRTQTTSVVCIRFI